MQTQNSGKDVVQLTILSNNTQLDAAYRILSVEVSSSFNRIAAAKISIADGDPALQDFPISNKDDTLFPGAELEIRIGYHSKPKTVFKGIIISQSIHSSKNKASVLKIEAKDKFVLLTVARKSHCYTDKTDADIIRAIVKDAGLSAADCSIEDTSVKHAGMVQYNTSDWDFLVCRAEMNSMVASAEGNKLKIGKPAIDTSNATEIVFGGDIIEFECETDGRTQLGEIKAKGWNSHDQKVIESNNATSSFKETGKPDGSKLADAMGLKKYFLTHAGIAETTELQAWSDALLTKTKISKTAGRIKIQGNPEIKTGNTLQLKGFGKHFNGAVCVSGVHHSYNKSIWETEIFFGLPINWYAHREDIIDKPAAGLLPGVTGLQIGVVTQLEDDPAHEHRIRIKLPLVDQQEAIWARIATLDAGKERGSFFRPEINDEVIVGFVNEDPRFPIVLGMLNSSALPAPLKAKDNNH
jgi:Rhs element Vgr protein